MTQRVSGTPAFDLVATGFDPMATGRTAVAVAIVAVVSIVTLVLLYGGLPVFGPVNDLTNAVGGLVTAILAWRLHALARVRAPRTAAIFLVSAWVGSAAIVGNSLLVAAGQLDWMTGGMYTALGLGLQGIWLFGTLRLIASVAILGSGLRRLGTVAAIAMWFGLLAGPLLASGIDLAASPVTWVAYAGAAGGWLLYPIWCWLTGRRLLAAGESMT